MAAGLGRDDLMIRDSISAHHNYKRDESKAKQMAFFEMLLKASVNILCHISIVLVVTFSIFDHLVIIKYYQ